MEVGPSPHQKKYHSFKLEILTVKWVACNHFRYHPYYAPHFKLYNDNNPVTYITITGRMSATGRSLAIFNFSIHYSPEKQNVKVDILSRLSANTHAEYMEVCTKLIFYLNKLRQY